MTMDPFEASKHAAEYRKRYYQEHRDEIVIWKRICNYEHEYRVRILEAREHLHRVGAIKTPKPKMSEGEKQTRKLLREIKAMCFDAYFNHLPTPYKHSDQQD